MKKIKVCLAWHNVNSSNFGVSALAISQIALLVSAAREANVEIELSTLGTPNVGSLNIRKMVEEKYGLKIDHEDYTLKIILKSILKFNFNFISTFKKFDLIMDIGEGDSFTDIYGLKRFFLLSFTKIIPLLQGKKLILSPQTIGPFNNSIIEKLSVQVLKRAEYVYTRDFKSTAYLASLNVRCTEVSDVAFTLPFEANKKKADDIGINVSGLLLSGGYSKNNQFGLKGDYMSLAVNLVNGFLERGKTVHLVSHVIAENDVVEDDYHACELVKCKFQDDLRVIVAPKFDSPITAKAYMSQLSFFTGSRMHATIGALSAGVVTVPIAYSRKFSGVFGSLNYKYTLDAYSLDENQLCAKLFDLFDNNYSELNASMISALQTSKLRNNEYKADLVKVLLNER